MKTEAMMSEINEVSELFANRFREQSQNLNEGKWIESYLHLLALLLHLHDRIIYARYGAELRSKYMNRIYDIISERYKTSNNDETKLEKFRNFMNESQMAYSKYKTIITGAENLQDNLLWNASQLLLQDWNITDPTKVMTTYQFMVSITNDLSVNNIELG